MSISPFYLLQEFFIILQIDLLKQNLNNFPIHHLSDQYSLSHRIVLKRKSFINDFSFLIIVNEQNVTICERELTAKDVNLFRYAVVNNYWYQMFLGK